MEQKMNRILMIIYMLLLISINNNYAQNDEFTCGTTPPPGESIDLSQQGGIHLTSSGVLRMLVVFVSFKDDTTSHPSWPVGQPPANYNTFIDAHLKINSTHYNNFTNYFKQMSLGVFKVIGQAVYVKTPQNKAAYGSTNPNRYLATKDVLQNAVDSIVNFNDYDNWSSSANYNHSNQPDGTVDMIVMVWRGAVFEGGWSGEASLGYGASYTVENGTKTIKAGFTTNNGSGVTVTYPKNKWHEWMLKTSVHEVGHWLLGGWHPYQTYNEQHHIWGILSSGGTGICTNTYESERLAWINPTIITGDILNAPFQDYVAYGTAYKYHPPNGATNEYYYFENHQKLSIYDNATTNNNDKGIFVIHQQNIYNEQNIIRVKTSNGQWNWQNPFNSVCFDDATVPSFKPTTINRQGLNNRDLLPKSGGGSDWLFSLINESGQASCGDYMSGGGLNNSFNTTYSDVFSPYSNPYTHTWNNTQNNFAMEIIGQNVSVVNAKFYITNPLNGKPSKPQDLLVGSSTNYHPQLNWAANIEPDLANYKIYKKVTAEWGWQYLATTTATTYEDLTEIYLTGGHQSFEHNIDYRITAVDNQSLESIPSDKVTARVAGAALDKKGNEDYLTEHPTDYKLYQNYPNPFNPVTNIIYQIPKSGLVQLKVFDLLGSEVAELVNEEKAEGSYSINFDASNLPSGVYIYSLRVNDYIQNNKMTLLK
jgi:hypothetical protein